MADYKSAYTGAQIDSAIALANTAQQGIPYVYGTEYATADKWKGKPVFVKAIDLGALPDTSNKGVSTGLSSGEIFSISGSAVKPSDGVVQVLPMFNVSGSCVCKVHVSSISSITIYTFSNISSYSAYAIIKYIKA